MPRKCTICEKKSVMASQRKKLMSKYNPTPKKRKYPNLQTLNVPIEVEKSAYKEYAGKKIIACTKCIKTLSKNR
jgi:ribosomal protein L28